MKLGWLLIGIIVAVLIFIFVPGLFDRLVSGVQWIIHGITSMMGSVSTNSTGVFK